MKPGAPHPPNGTGPPLVLAVDDQSDYLDALEALLVGEGYDVVTSTSAADALIRAREFTPTLLITDLNMDPCDGVEFLPGFERAFLGAASLRVFDAELGGVSIEHPPDDRAGEYLA